MKTGSELSCHRGPRSRVQKQQQRVVSGQIPCLSRLEARVFKTTLLRSRGCATPVALQEPEITLLTGVKPNATGKPNYRVSNIWLISNEPFGRSGHLIMMTALASRHKSTAPHRARERVAVHPRIDGSPHRDNPSPCFLMQLVIGTQAQLHRPKMRSSAEQRFFVTEQARNSRVVGPK